MSNFKPGEFRITDEAMKEWDLPKCSKVLDIGCGQGETMEHLEENYGFVTCGIDRSMPMLQKGKTRNPNLDLQYGDGEFLDGFTSYTFDGVLMECTLSLINMPDESLHEVYCVLKKGGKLFISDLFVKNPAPEFLKVLAIEAERQARIPHQEGSCGSDHEEGQCECDGEHEHTHDLLNFDHNQGKKLVPFRSSGRFLMEPFIAQLQEIGYTNIQWKDCSEELDSFVAEKLMSDGCLDGCICDEALHPKDNYKTGYFMLTAEKPI